MGVSGFIQMSNESYSKTSVGNFNDHRCVFSLVTHSKQLDEFVGSGLLNRGVFIV